MVDLNQVKKYLRIDSDYEDDLLQEFLKTAREYLKGAITDFERLYSESEEFEQRADYLIMALVLEYYENRSNEEHNLSYTLRSMMVQLQYFTSGV